MINITKTEEILSKCPNVRLALVKAKVKVKTTVEELSEQIEKTCQEIQQYYENTEAIRANTVIANTRKAYKALGKDPSRYRPSAEALLRRVVQGKGLYQINNVVDLLNTVSIQTGFSIGGYDLSKVEGEIELAVGQEDEPYAAIGRGKLNIGCLPVLQDRLGTFGSPTSDSQRTSVQNSTEDFLMVFFDFASDKQVEEACLLAVNLLEKHAEATEILTLLL
ncbi:MAG: hypothetical protein MK212_04660 [Saprospiraceae bacterium]|nr:hypothetical protein [Saprospiraceae bacterium]